MGHEHVQRHPRHRVQLLCELLDAMTLELRTVIIRDLSLGGARIEDATPPEVGSIIRLRVAFDRERAPIAFGARVVHVVTEHDALGRKPGMGVAFLMPETVVDVVRRYLDFVAAIAGEEDGAQWAMLPPPTATE